MKSKILNIITFFILVGSIFICIIFLKEFIDYDELYNIEVGSNETGEEFIIEKEDNQIAQELEVENMYNETSTDCKKYYYAQLDSYGKMIYNALEENIGNLKDGKYVINFEKKFNQLLNEENGSEKINISYQSALDAFLLDKPEIYYLDITKMYLTMNSKTIGKNTTYTVTLGPKENDNYFANGFKSKEQIEETDLKIKEIKNEILTKSTSNQYKNIKKIHNWIVDNVSYEQTISKSNIRNIYGALIENEVVCEGYAKVFKYLLDSINIENIIVIGKATNSEEKTEAHAWNYINVNDTWYATDITWDDPILRTGRLSDKNRYQYFFKGEKTFNKNHIATGKTSEDGIIFTYPELSENNL